MPRLVLAFAASLALLVPAAPVGAAGVAKRLPLGKCGSPKRVPVAARKTGKVIDFDILPLNSTVRTQTCMTWKWSAANTQIHDVRLRTGPKGVKKFHSVSATTDYSYSYYFKTRGTYRLYCQFHPNMLARLTVR